MLTQSTVEPEYRLYLNKLYIRYQGIQRLLRAGGLDLKEREVLRLAIVGPCITGNIEHPDRALKSIDELLESWPAAVLVLRVVG